MAQLNKLYSVFDKKSGSWEKPFAARTHGEAERMFQSAANDKQTIIGQYPEDFSLWCVGNFDPHTGTINNREHESIGEAVAFLQRQPQNEVSR